MKTRNIIRTVKGVHTIDGAGVKLIRVLGHDDTADIDPFLMMDAFGSTNPADYIKGFPMHPHRGIETFTYLIDGEIDHRDTLGNAGRIMGGQAQWMNSGSGILHEEMPKATDRLFGLQLWINLPAKHKMTAPTYQDIHASDMPVMAESGATIKVVAGNYKNSKGAHGHFVQPLILDIKMNPNGDFSLSLPEDNTLFIYMLDGEGAFGEIANAINERTAAIFDNGDTMTVKSGNNGCHFMLFAAKPLREPIAWAGPIVMNTQQELDTAFVELNRGTFIKT